VPAAVAALGRLDAVVNNASLFEYDSVASFSTRAMDRAWRSNTAPAVLLARALHAHVLAGPWIRPPPPRPAAVSSTCLTRSWSTPTPITSLTP